MHKFKAPFGLNSNVVISHPVIVFRQSLANHGPKLPLIPIFCQNLHFSQNRSLFFLNIYTKFKALLRACMCCGHFIPLDLKMGQIWLKFIVLANLFNYLKNVHYYINFFKNMHKINAPWGLYYDVENLPFINLFCAKSGVKLGQNWLILIF